MADPNWATSMKSFWIQHIPTSVAGDIPNWTKLQPLVLASFQAGRPVTYNNASGYQYMMYHFDASYFYFYRMVFKPSSTVKVQYYNVKIDRSTGTVSSETISVNS